MMPPRDPDDLRGQVADLALNQTKLANAVLVLGLAIKDLSEARADAAARASLAVEDSNAVFAVVERQLMGRVT